MNCSRSEYSDQPRFFVGDEIQKIAVDRTAAVSEDRCFAGVVARDIIDQLAGIRDP